MTVEPATQGISAAAFLFDEKNDSVKALAEALKESGVVATATAGLSNLTRAGLNAVGGQIASIAHDLVDIEFDELILEGWRKLGDLNAAAKRTRDASGTSEVVDLAAHHITSNHNPRVELRVDDVTIATVTFELSLGFTLKAVVATVRAGRLVALNAGQCDVEGSLKAEGKQLAKRTGHFELPLLVRLGNGVPLLVDDGLEAVGGSAPVVEAETVGGGEATVDGSR
ncbi:hypothetical protein ACWEOW_15540 [Monashia sp. NPDC004114]